MVVEGVYTKPQRLVSQQTAQKKANPRKFYKKFAFKMIVVVVFLVIIPLFPSEPPDFVSTTSVLSKSWELFQLIFVGIVVSYGLFSRRNEDEYDHGGGGGGGGTGTGAEAESGPHKYEGVQSYVSKLLHDVVDVDSFAADVNDDDDDDSCGREVQTWSSKYVRKEPMLVVSESRNEGDKPLLLPVRSLKSRFYCDDGVSRSGSSRVGEGFSRDLRRLSVDGNDSREELGFGVIKGHVRSSSSLGGSSSVKSRGTGSSEFGDVVGGGGDGDGKGLRPLSRANSYVSSRELARSSRKSLSVDYGRFGDGEGKEYGWSKEEESMVLPSPIPWQSRSGRMEVKGESMDDSSLHSLPPSLEESEAARLLKPQLSHSSSILSARYEFQGKSGEDFGRRKSNYRSHLPPPPPPPPPPPSSKSRRPPPAKSSPRKDVNRSVWSEPKDFEWGSSRDEGSQVKTRDGAVEGTSVGKSVRTARSVESRPKEVESPKTENSDGKTIGYNPMSKGSFLDYPKETRDFLEQVLLETDDESESEAENYREERVEPTKVNEPPLENVHDEESDVDKNVDKKADEFIAKFREQIRLQRIESIKKSTGQLKRSSVR
ncbi:hypothetical protein vseg_020348 [Gypsophila vaccaria]